MTKFISTLFFSLFVFTFCFAQRATVDIPTQNYTENDQSIALLKTHVFAIKEVPTFEDAPFIAVSVVWETHQKISENQRLWIGFGNQNGAWTDFYDLHEDGHGKHEVGRHVSNLIFVDAEETQFRLYFQTPSEESFDFDKVTVHFYNPGKTERQPNPVQIVDNRDACVCPIPDFLNREGWCPSGDCPEDTTPAFTNVTHLIVHHTASSNTASDWAAVVRSVWDFHVNTNGWDDVGYNWLIDPTGVLYQGRGDNVRGAHFCGNNTGTMGVAMIGNFVAANATEASKNTLKELLAWKSCDIDTDPLGTSFHTSSGMDLMNISGHRDGCNTTCPGDFFYPELPSIREDVVAIRANDCDAKLDAPTLAGAPITETQINLSWNDDTEEDSFILERSVGNDDNFQLLVELPANTTTYEDNSVAGSMDYYYRVRAVSDNIIDSDFSNEVMVSTDFSATEDYFLNTNTVQIFPNPNKGNFQLMVDNALQKNVQITVLDLTGKTVFLSDVWQKNSENVAFEVVLNEISAGTYFLKIQQDTHQGVFKLVIQ